ncbi:MAG: gliding motility-associated C-terminal domain-containing protein [Saprospirales bacterium]|nr:gliding motility-associated C-terminal domain-containing protein [Saprospirales bacterium]
MQQKIFLLLLLFCSLVYGQANLVPNPSFEDISQCPHASTGHIGFLNSWFSPVNSTPDVYNACDISSNGFGVPVHFVYCYQPARTADGYAGLYTYTYGVERKGEYIEAELKNKMEANKVYFVEMYVNAANADNCAISSCFSDGVGLVFLDEKYTAFLDIKEKPPFKADIENPSGNILNDTINWVRIKGCYYATGNERFIMIGNFKKNSETNSQGCVGVESSYLYIDDVGVYEFDPLPDTLLLCQGQTTSIGGSFLDGTYLWNTGDSDSTILVDQPGVYILTVAIDDCLLSDTVVVIRPEETLDALPSDTLICQGDPLLLQVHMPGAFEWSTGETANAIAIREAGFYSALIHNECGEFYYSIQVEEELCACDPFIPNAFSPNNDGINDYLPAFLHCDFPYRAIRFQVFSRWGELLYTDDSGQVQHIRWDGTFRGKPLETGVYLWTFEYEYDRHGKTRKEVRSGTVTLVR